jgi:hypothetical protein
MSRISLHLRRPLRFIPSWLIRPVSEARFDGTEDGTGDGTEDETEDGMKDGIGDGTEDETEDGMKDGTEVKTG